MILLFYNVHCSVWGSKVSSWCDIIFCFLKCFKFCPAGVFPESWGVRAGVSSVYLTKTNVQQILYGWAIAACFEFFFIIVWGSEMYCVCDAVSTVVYSHSYTGVPPPPPPHAQTNAHKLWTLLPVCLTLCCWRSIQIYWDSCFLWFSCTVRCCW